MEEFDVIVIGAGSGLQVSAAASRKGMKVAVVEEGPMGGTCLNRGCIPSKMLIHAAEIAQTVQNAAKFGIDAELKGIRFAEITKRVAATVDEEATDIEEANKKNPNITLFKARGKFVGEKTLEIEGKQIKGETIVIAAGTRPVAPPIPGLDHVEYLTSDNGLRLEKLPKSMVMVGGGYIASELAHFFGSLGTEMTIIEMAPKLLGRSDSDIANTFTEAFSQRFNVLLEHKVIKVAKGGEGVIVTVQDKDGKEKTVSGETLFLAVGRRPNTDVLDLEKTGVELTDKGYVKTNEYLETNMPGIWALGDIAGKWFFKHSANLEAEYVWRNALLGEKAPVDYSAIPHSVFTDPQIAGVGATEDELKTAGTPYKKGVYKYRHTGMGQAMMELHGFVKALADGKGEKILGCQILGPDASTLIHEVAVAMKNGLTVQQLAKTVHAHPALSEVVQRAFLAIR
ncbi:MAG: dihydrolipoyl dehydrogenase [Candidatus Terrybacteria bacterium RIFCSPHIGHO2_01_FULL_48_17]|uniref:Dihydrolipoyl dehydrogenase n=1 Tax=Candidatus Terrybacteria bacterium RIFCSPHIGHO2_01_FULL_48_17 TaxID=1802362 RepID=A0A1G2PJP9_9BACT|nr:MAG: dihydrolipoyl dehydrogenase [Candidatus Terrybacteria bacterium RIFCSPHIGHO2_01_FULL_48_17]OHA53595.1 MAG: dihydrolipoyl dehydrogenase [Candidatus Terrybacteria bacterium RIFCSPLOWO2_01_FULL_48_14]